MLNKWRLITNEFTDGVVLGIDSCYLAFEGALSVCVERRESMLGQALFQLWTQLLSNSCKGFICFEWPAIHTVRKPYSFWDILCGELGHSPGVHGLDTHGACISVSKIFMVLLSLSMRPGSPEMASPAQLYTMSSTEATSTSCSSSSCISRNLCLSISTVYRTEGVGG